MERAKVFLLGVLFTVGLLVLLGAGPIGKVNRFQPVTLGIEGVAIYAVQDTSTGHVFWFNPSVKEWVNLGNPWN